MMNENYHICIEKTSNNGNKYFIKNDAEMIISEAKTYDWNIPGFDWILIADVETLPSQRGKGYASSIIDKIEFDIDKNKGLYLFVKDNNENAINLYEKKGFKTIRGYNLSNGNHFIMVKGDADEKQFDKMRFS